jgi:hypothetical protein
VFCVPLHFFVLQVRNYSAAAFSYTNTAFIFLRHIFHLAARNELQTKSHFRRKIPLQNPRWAFFASPAGESPGILLGVLMLTCPDLQKAGIRTALIKTMGQYRLLNYSSCANTAFFLFYYAFFPVLLFIRKVLSPHPPNMYQTFHQFNCA